jgi:hypothetical protein
MKEQFLIIIYDDETYKMEVLGPMSDDSLIVNNIVEMQKAKMNVHCNSADKSAIKEKLKLSGYNFEDDLYDNLISKYFQLTNKQLNKW